MQLQLVPEKQQKSQKKEQTKPGQW